VVVVCANFQNSIFERITKPKKNRVFNPFVCGACILLERKTRNGKSNIWTDASCANFKRKYFFAPVPADLEKDAFFIFVISGSENPVKNSA